MSSPSTADAKFVDFHHELQSLRPKKNIQDAQEISKIENVEFGFNVPEDRIVGNRRYLRYNRSKSGDNMAKRAASRLVNVNRASAYSTLSVRSWSEINTELNVVMRDLSKASTIFIFSVLFFVVNRILSFSVCNQRNLPPVFLLYLKLFSFVLCSNI